MEGKKRRNESRWRSKSTRALSTILELDGQPIGQNCIPDDDPSTLLTYEQTGTKEFLSENESSKPDDGREDPVGEENISEQTTVGNKQLDGLSDRSIQPPQENIGRSLGGHQNFKDYDQKNDRLCSTTVDLSNGKTLAEFLRIDEIVSSAVSKHLEKLASLLVVNKSDGSNVEASKAHCVQGSNVFEDVWKTRTVSRTENVVDEERWRGEEEKSRKSTLDYVPTRDRMSVLARKYLSSSNGTGCEGIRAGGKEDHLPESADAVLEKPRKENGQENSNPRDFNSSQTVRHGTALERHSSVEKGDLQGLGAGNLLKTAAFTRSVPSDEAKMNGLLTRQPNGINSENIDSKIGCEPLADINANFDNYQVVSSGKNEPKIQHVKSLPTAETARHTNEAKDIGLKDPPSSYQQDISSTTTQPACLAQFPKVPCASGTVSLGPWRVCGSFDQNLYQDSARPNDGCSSSRPFPSSLPSKFNSMPISSNTFVEAPSIVQDSKITPLTHKGEKAFTSDKDIDGHVAKLASVMTTGKNTVQNEHCKSKSRSSENTSTVKAIGKNTVHGESYKSKNQCSRDSPERAIHQRSMTKSIKDQKNQNDMFQDEQKFTSFSSSRKIKDLSRNNSITCKESTGLSKIQTSRYQLMTSVAGNCSADNSSAKSASFTPTNDYPAESCLSPSSRSPKVLYASPRSPSSPFSNAEKMSFFGNLEILKKSSDGAPEFLEKYRTDLFCDQNYTKEKLRTTSRNKDSPRNQPVVVSPRSGVFSFDTNNPQKQSSSETISKKVTVCGGKLKRSVSLNDISTKHPTKDSDISFKANSEKIRELSSSLESLFNKVSDLSKNALMRHKKSEDERMKFLKIARTRSLESLKNRPWKSMDNLLMPDDPCSRPSYMFCRRLEAEKDKIYFTNSEAETLDQVPSQMSMVEDRAMPQHEVVAHRNTRGMETNGHMFDTSLKSSKSPSTRAVPEIGNKLNNFPEYSEGRICRQQKFESRPCDHFSSNYNQRDQIERAYITGQSRVQSCELSDTPGRNEIIEAMGSLRTSASSKKNTFRGTSETSRTLDLTHIPGHREIVRPSGTSLPPQSLEPRRQNGITLESRTSRTSKSARTPGPNEMTILSRKSESTNRPRRIEIIGMSGTSAAPELSETSGGNEELGVSRTSVSPDRPESNEMVRVAGTSRTPKSSETSGENEVLGVSRTWDGRESNEMVGVSETSRTSESSETPGRNEAIGLSRTSESPDRYEGLSRTPEQNEIIGVPRTSESSHRPRRIEIIRMSGTSTVPEFSEISGRNEVIGVSRTSVSPDRPEINELVGVPGTSRITGLSGTRGRNEVMVISKRSRTSESSDQPKRNEIIRESGTARVPESSKKAGTLRTLKSTKTACEKGPLENLENNEKANGEASGSQGVPRISEHLCDRVVKKKAHNRAGRERRVEKVNSDVKNCPQQSNLRTRGNQGTKLPEELQKPKRSKTMELNEITGNSTVRVTFTEWKHRCAVQKDSDLETGSDNQNTEWQSCLPLGSYENVLAEPATALEASTFSPKQTENRNQVSKLPSSDALDRKNTNNTLEYMKPEKSSASSNTRERSKSTTKNKNDETRRRRKGVFEAPEVLRSRLISQEEVNRLKMCFLSAQRQNNGLGQRLLLQNVSGSLKKNSCINVEVEVLL